MSPADPGPGAAGEILVAEHEPAVAELIRRYLAREGLRVRCARTPGETEAALAAPAVAVAAVLDLTMPGLDARAIRKLIRGGQQARRGRSQPAVAGPAPGVPVICLTAGEAAHAVPGLRPRDIGVGEQSCVTRPFGPRTLVALVRAAARNGRSPAAAVSAAGRLRLEPARRRATLDGTEVALTGTEFDVLSCLVHSAGRAVPRNRLHQAVWGDGSAPQPRMVDVYVAQLRAKLGPGHGIRTVRGVGYVMDPGDQAEAPARARTASTPGGRAGVRSAPATIGDAGHPIRGDSRTA